MNDCRRKTAVSYFAKCAAVHFGLIIGGDQGSSQRYAESSVQ
jgi:hypothetical protein